jgi:hypothetical protein
MPLRGKAGESRVDRIARVCGGFLEDQIRRLGIDPALHQGRTVICMPAEGDWFCLRWMDLPGVKNRGLRLTTGLVLEPGWTPHDGFRVAMMLRERFNSVWVEPLFRTHSPALPDPPVFALDESVSKM